MKSFLALGVALFLVGCTHHHPMLSSGQTDRIDREDRYMKKNAGEIYSAIHKANTLGALTIVPANLSESPHVIPGNSPVGLLYESDNNFEDTSTQVGRTCYFVYSEDASSAPLRMPCKAFVESVRPLRDMKATQDGFAAGLVPTMYLVKFQSAQLEQLEKQIGTVSKALSASSSAQATANELLKQTIEQIAKSYAEFNSQLNEVVKRLEQIK